MFGEAAKRQKSQALAVDVQSSMRSWQHGSLEASCEPANLQGGAHADRPPQQGKITSA